MSNKTRLPGYTAEVSLGPSSRPYYSVHRHAGATGSVIVPQQRGGRLGFACTGTHCACHGIPDCGECMIDGWCVGPCHCDATGTCIC